MEIDAINYLKYIYPEDLYITEVPEAAPVLANVDLPEEQEVMVQEEVKEELKEGFPEEKPQTPIPLVSVAPDDPHKTYDLVVILPSVLNDQPAAPENELLKNIIAAIHIKSDRTLCLHDGLDDEYIKQRIDASQCYICLTFGTRNVKNIPKTVDFYQIIEIDGVKFIHSTSLESLIMYRDEKVKLWETLKTII
ncbi:MAG: hypothetical protein JJU28_07330 [Cyclobacteriaceae bacterium]|nr:hypothetical protein [Cyclobacteriaceae bacterium]